jgi:hypothetical protein
MLESSVRKAAEEITDLVLNFLPDENGKVGVAESIQRSSGKVEGTK